jgi:flavorubredoxin
MKWSISKKMLLYLFFVHNNQTTARIVVSNQPKSYYISSDECGGLFLLLKNFPEATAICSEITARQLMGFGFTNKAIIKKTGEKLIGSNYELEFISYPSEVHLWEGILLIENKRGILFSSDLIFGMGEANGEVVDGNWQKEVDAITSDQIPSTEHRKKVQQALSKLNPKFAAVGHGQCLKF